MFRRRSQLVAAFAALSACAKPTDDSSAGPDISALAWAARECPWAVACRQYENASACVATIVGDEDYDRSAVAAAGLDERLRCVDTATSCTDYATCTPTLMQVRTGRPEDYVCPGDREAVCEDEVELWCRGGDGYPAAAGEPPILVRRGDEWDMNCGPEGWLVDREPGSCEGSETICAGTGVRRCGEGYSVTYDCAEIGDDFTCQQRPEGDLYCGVRADAKVCTPGIPPDFANEYAWGACEGDVAVVCYDGVEIAVDCASTGTRCVMLAPGWAPDVPNATCR